MRLVVGLAWLGTFASCRAEDPGVGPVMMRADAPSRVFADTLIGYRLDNITTTCTSELGVCDGQLSTGSCAPNPALGGPEDGMAFLLDALGTLEVGFRCAWIMQHGVDAGGNLLADLRIVATGPVGAQAEVEVSYDGSTYIDLPPSTPSLGQARALLRPGENRLSLAPAEVDIVRFVRIIDTGAGGLGIDAVEAL